MITVAGFLIGLVLIVVGFYMVWKGSRLRQTVGDLASIIGVSWLDWPVIGVVIMVAGGLLMTGLLETLLLGLLGGFLNSAV